MELGENSPRSELGAWNNDYTEESENNPKGKTICIAFHKVVKKDAPLLFLEKKNCVMRKVLCQPVIEILTPRLVRSFFISLNCTRFPREMKICYLAHSIFEIKLSDLFDNIAFYSVS